MDTMWLAIHFIIMGLLGGFLHILVKAEKWDDLKRFKNLRDLIISAIIGYVYSILYSDYNFPDSIMCLVAGYMGKDFIQSIITRFTPKE